MESLDSENKTRSASIQLKPLHLFRYESGLNKEAHGGYLDGSTEFPGLQHKDDLENVEFYLSSDIHNSKQHCNFIHITGNGYKREKNRVKNGRSDKDWKFTLVNDNGTWKLEQGQHEYIKNELVDKFWVGNTLVFGAGKLQFTVGIPLSKSNGELKRILEQRSSPQDVIDEISHLCKKGEPFLHVARLTVKARVKGSPVVYLGTSDIILDKNRYEFSTKIKDTKLSNISGNIILNNSFFQRYTIIFEKCMLPEKLSFSAQFVYKDLQGEEGNRTKVTETEIKVLSVRRTGHEKKSLDVYFSANCGQILASVFNGKLKLYLQLSVLENGNLGDANHYRQIISKINVDEIEIGKCVPHNCAFDQTLRNTQLISFEEMMRTARKELDELELNGNNSNALCGECYRAINDLEQLLAHLDIKLDDDKKASRGSNCCFNETPHKIPRLTEDGIPDEPGANIYLHIDNFGR